MSNLLTKEKNRQPNSTLRLKAHRVTEILRSIYHSPRHNNKSNPLDELIFIILSQMTTYWSFERVFNRLKTVENAWDTIRKMRLSKLKSTINDAGLSNQKAPRIRAILNKIKNDFGRLTLLPLKKMSSLDAENYLRSLPGIQMKSAKCILMYSFRRKVLPVDTHVLRLARRLGFTRQKVISDKVHLELENLVKPRDRYGFHVNAVAHGRAVCRALEPRCPACALKRLCEYYKSNPPKSQRL